MHELKIVDGNAYLDGFRLKGVKEYAIKRSAAQGGSAEITLTLVVGSINKSPGQPETNVMLEINGKKFGEIAQADSLSIPGDV